MTLEDLPSLSLNPDTFYFVSPWGLGDTMILCGLKPALEQKLGGKIHLIVKPSHEVILRMYDDSAYTLAKTVHSNPHLSPTLTTIAKHHPHPQKGCFYVAHPDFFPHFKQLFSDMQTGLPHIPFLSWYRQFFGLPDNSVFSFPKHYPSISPALQDRFQKLAPQISLDQTVLILPEAMTVTEFPRVFWEALIQQQKKLGYCVISNITNPSMPHFSGVPNIDLSLEELVALSLACKEVFAIRSGICDLIFSKQEHLHVFYPNNAIRRIFSLKEMFQANRVQEISFEEAGPDIESSQKIGPFIKKKSVFFHSTSIETRTQYRFHQLPLLTITESIE